MLKFIPTSLHFRVLATSLLALSFSSHLSASDLKTAEYPTVHFENLKDGAKVTSPIDIKFSIRVWDVKPAGDMSPNTGHHHLIIDGAPVPEGQVVPKDAKHIHFGKGEAETTIELPPGRHTLTLQFANGAHISYGKDLSTSITVNVVK